MRGGATNHDAGGLLPVEEGCRATEAQAEGIVPRSSRFFNGLLGGLGSLFKPHGSSCHG